LTLLHEEMTEMAAVQTATETLKMSKAPSTYQYCFLQIGCPACCPTNILNQNPSTSSTSHCHATAMQHCHSIFSPTPLNSLCCNVSVDFTLYI